MGEFDLRGPTAQADLERGTVVHHQTAEQEAAAARIDRADQTVHLVARQRLGAQLDVGTVFMNRCDYLDPELAWVGVRDSGRGVTLSRFGFDGFTRLKSLHLRHAIP